MPNTVTPAADLPRRLRPLAYLSCALAAPFLASLPAKAELVNRWSFNNAAGNAPRGTALTDSVGGATATVFGNGSSFTGSGLTITGNTTGNRSGGQISGYVDLPNGLISSKTNLSIELWATPISIRTYARLCDFGRVNTAGHGGGAPGEIIPVVGMGQAPGSTSGSDNVFLSFCVGDTLNTQRFEARLNAGNVATDDTNVTTTPGTQYHYVLTFQDGVGAFGASGGRATWYRNGTLVTSIDVAFHLSSLEDVNNWLGRSQWTDDDNANANYNELRIYNHALSTADIAANFAAGPEVIDPPDPVDPPVPDHRWTFTTQAQAEAPSGITFDDEEGDLIATLRGNGGSLTGGAVVLPGSTTGNQPASVIAAYLDLPNGIVSATPNVSFEAWAAPLSSKNWQRLFDFGRCVLSSARVLGPERSWTVRLHRVLRLAMTT